MRWWPWSQHRHLPEPPRLPAGLVPLQPGEVLLQPAQRQAARAALQQIALGDDPAQAALWDATLIAFAGFCQSLTRPCPDPNDSTTLLDLGLMNVLNRLSAPATGTGTGYGLLAWALLDVLEQEIGRQQVLLFDRQGQPLNPWTPLNGAVLTVPGAVYYRAAFRDHDAEPLPGLDLALAAVVLPPAGLARLLGEPDQGRVWLAQHALAQMPVCPPPTAVTDSFGTVLMDALRTWLLEPDRLGSGPDSAGWRSGDDLYLVGKQVAEALRQQPALAAYQRQIERNPALYRRLVAEGIAVSAGDKPVWKITVSGAGWTQTVAAVRIPLHRLWPGPGTIPPLPVFAGQILPQEPP